MREVAADGAGSARIISFVAPRGFESVDEEDAVQFYVEVSGLDYLSRTLNGDIIYIGGNDVNCERKDGDKDGDNDLVLENSFLKAVFNATEKAAPLQQLNTANNIVSVTEKTGNTTVRFANTSFVLGGDASTSAGTGYSEIRRQDSSAPLCDVHFFVNSTVDYDIFYRLYAGADFLSVEVRNIR